MYKYIQINKEFYHSTDINNFKLNNNRHIWLSEKKNYAKYIINGLFNNAPSDHSNIFIIKNLKKLILIEVENEIILNYLYLNKYFFNRYCNLLKIDGFFTKNSFHEGAVYLIYLFKIEDWLVLKLDKNKYPKYINFSIKLYSSINVVILFIIFTLCYIFNLQNTNNYKKLKNDIIITNNIFLKNINEKYIIDFQKKRYNLKLNIFIPKSK